MCFDQITPIEHTLAYNNMSNYNDSLRVNKFVVHFLLNSYTNIFIKYIKTILKQ